MRSTILQLEQIIDKYGPLLARLTEDELQSKPNPDKWSRKEMIGHLVDSAQNNIRRFVVAQYEHQPRIGYDQDFWLKAVNYQHYYSADLVNLWILLNKHACRVLQQIDPQTAKTKESISDEPHNIEWLAADYNKHLLHHLHQLLDLEPVAYP